MAQQTINIGSAPNDGLGDPLRTAFTKSNSNFSQAFAWTVAGLSVSSSPDAAGLKSALVLVKSDVGLGNADNTSDANKPVSTATQAALNLKADLASPALSGNPTAPTQTAGNNSTRLATTAYVETAVAAAGGVASFNTRTGSVTLTSLDVTGALTYTPATTASVALKADIASPALTGTPTAPTPGAADNSTKIATTAYVDAAVAGGVAGVASFNSRTGVVTLSSSDVTTALTYTPSSVTGLTGTQSVAAFKTGLTLVKADVGLGNVDNTSDANKPVSTATQTALNLKADLASPALTGNPTAPTQTAGNNSTRVATTAYVDTGLALKANLASPTFTGTPAGPTASAAAGTTQLATTAYADRGDQQYQGINPQTGTTYTFVLTDHGKLVTGSNASAITWTVPPNSSVAFAVNDRIDIAQTGAGQISIAAGAGVTIRSSGSKLKLTGQYSGAGLTKLATDEWLLIGDIAT